MTDWIPDEGLRFECTACGACCTGPPGYVMVTDEEVTALAARFGFETGDFAERYTHAARGGRSLNETETQHGYDCVLLDRESVPGKAVCSAYGDRPAQCRTFPWWPEHTRSRQGWERLAHQCEGVGLGGLIPVEEITKNLQEQRDRDARVNR